MRAGLTSSPRPPRRCQCLYQNPHWMPPSLLSLAVASAGLRPLVSFIALYPFFLQHTLASRLPIVVSFSRSCCGISALSVSPQLFQRMARVGEHFPGPRRVGPRIHSVDIDEPYVLELIVEIGNIHAVNVTCL